MMDDQLVEIDAAQLVASRHFVVTKGKEMGMAGPPMTTGAHAGHDMGGHGLTNPAPGDSTCSPTWAQPSPDGRRVYVACNRTSDIVEVDVDRWALVRRIPAGNGVYNLAMTRDGTRLIATNKRDQSVSIIELPSGRELARLKTKRRVVHGAAVSADDRYAFVTVEGVGSEPGTLEIIDLRALATVATVDVGQMAGGVDVLSQRAAVPTR
jgi:DNA-binding beta-propeller fold protein YncE